MRVFTLFIFIFFYNFCLGQNQGLNNLWLLGYSSSAGLPFGGTNINYFSGTPAINYVYRTMDLNRTHSNITDTSGTLLFYTNGYDIADVTDSIMQNGSNISPSSIKTAFPYGLPIPQACLIIPTPSNNQLYFLFHSSADNAPNYDLAYYLYYSIIDMSLNSGHGAVTSKNNIIINGILNLGKITACKHANGRDWWIVCLQANTNLIYTLLLSPSGISGPYLQNIGASRIKGFGQVKFSPDGNKFAYFMADYNTIGNLEIFDFDRCAGIFSNALHIVIPQSTGFGGGVEFSPNSTYLYACNIDSVYQYDLTSTNIPNSKTVVAAWDSFYSPLPPFSTLFDPAELASDGKIYIATGNGTFHMHVINQPDSLGMACDLVQHGIQLPTYNFNTLPNHPNYFLGRLIGSPCDTVWAGIASPQPKEAAIKVLSNPNNGRFTLWFSVHDKPGTLEVYNINGDLILHDAVATWSQYKQVNITSVPAGMYMCRLCWGNTSASVKVVKE